MSTYTRPVVCPCINADCALREKPEEFQNLEGSISEQFEVKSPDTAENPC